MTTAGVEPGRAEGTETSRRAVGLRSWLLVAPLVAFIGVTFVAPLGAMLVRSVHTPVVADALPETIASLRLWDGEGVPAEAAFAAVAGELLAAHEMRTLGQVTTRVGRLDSRLRSVITRTVRGLRHMKSGVASTPDSWRDAMIGIDRAWGDRSTWVAISRAGERYTARHYLKAVDLDRDSDGQIVARSADVRIYLPLLGRTLLTSLVVTLACLALGYPVAYLIAYAPPRRANLLLLLVLVPFWTSLLARAASWIVLLQSQGVINDFLAAVGLVGEGERVAMIYNLTGTMVAMTHVLLPFMVLPLYAVMRAIPPDCMRAATLLGGLLLASVAGLYLLFHLFDRRVGVAWMRRGLSGSR